MPHSGYVFNYDTNLPESEGALPIPTDFDGVRKAIRDSKIVLQNGLDQLTINEFVRTCIETTTV